MAHHEEPTKIDFTSRNAWLGFVSYLILIAIIVSAFYTG
jgi:hypothetical protein